jgi:hypothetical protein
MKIRKSGAGLVAAGLLLLAGCGGSGLVDSSNENDRQRNSALSEDQAGLNVQVYKIDQDQISVLLRTEDESGYNNFERDPNFFPECEGAVTSVANLNGLSEVFNSCRSELVAAHYTGYITIPGTSGDAAIEFASSSDDGFSMAIDGDQVIDNWFVQGCGESKGKKEGVKTLTAGRSYPVDAWYFNNRGNYCMQALWNVNGETEVIPASAFSKVDPSAPETSTTEPEVTTTTEAPTDVTIPASGDDAIVSVLINPENPEPISIPESSTEYSCNEACVAALRVALDTPTGDIVVNSGGVKTVLSGNGKQSIKLGASAKSLDFSVDGSEKTVSIPLAVAEEDSTSTTSTVKVEDYSDFKVDSKMSLPVVIGIAVVVLLLLAGGAIAMKRRKTA